MEPTSHYKDEYYYLEGEDKCLVAIYGSAEEAKLASTQRNLATVATTCFSEIWAWFKNRQFWVTKQAKASHLISMAN